MRLVFISDTHNHIDFKIPKGDILVHSGDLTMMGRVPEVVKSAEWLGKLKDSHGFKAIVLVPGNHDWLAEKEPGLMRAAMEEVGVVYLDHKAAVVEGLRFFGSGYTPRFYDWALNVDRGPKLAALWAQIPDDTQVLITHGPPMGQLDTCPARDDDGYPNGLTEHVGCADLRDRIKDLKDLKVHAFGHIHRPGKTVVDGVAYFNASTCNERYKPVHEPQVFDIRRPHGG
jgi:Icc-related predicted phosphoesterase